MQLAIIKGFLFKHLNTQEGKIGGWHNEFRCTIKPFFRRCW
jgi:hypothetical protein